jgi:tyrosyl-tRNA synthetase
VHGEDDYNLAVETSQILFNGSINDLAKLDEATFLDVFDGVPQFNIAINDLKSTLTVVDLLAEKTQIAPSKSEARKLIAGGGVSINKEKVQSPETLVNESYLINQKYILVQKGKKNYFLIVVN